ncbi:MAG: ComEA family DNA-binding protein [Clostridioides sp.]|jgi:competence protein ComEA|nr:ComEA family DNA-binding protein [Clostridioides sp.]
MKKKHKILLISMSILTVVIVFGAKMLSFNNGLYVAGEKSKVNDGRSGKIKEDGGDLSSKEDKKDGMSLEKKSEEAGEKNSGTITIYVSGAVEKPGIVTVDSNKRLFDAVAALGGTTAEANLDGVNMAKKLEDGKHYVIPKKGEPVLVDEADIPSDESSASNNSSGNANAGNSNGTSSNQSGKVNINTADAKELDTLPGVGESTAEKIIQYREKNGKFNNIEDIKNVSGIGDKKFDALKDLICIK